VTRPPQSINPQRNSSPSSPRRAAGGFVTTTTNTTDDSDPEAGAAPGRDESPSAASRLLPQLFKRRAGRRWDHLRSSEPVIVPQHRLVHSSQQASPWREFVQASRYPHIPNEESEVVDDEVLAKLQPSFGYPVHIPRSSTVLAGGGAGGTGGAGGSGHKHHRPWYRRVLLLPLRHPLGPLACRLTVLSTSIIALALAVRIFQSESLHGRVTPEGPQIIVAIIIDVVAIPYIGYITVDDYTGKPLGLRDPKERVRLILMDLVFIIFKSASTALGFEALIFFTTTASLAYLQALCAFELIGLISWAMTLTINVFREIERVGG